MRKHIKNPSIWTCKCDKKCEIEEYLNNCAQSAINYLVIACEDETLNSITI